MNSLDLFAGCGGMSLGPNTALIIHENLVKLIEESKNK
jgi:site-specific DNA-cytosine methylase